MQTAAARYGVSAASEPVMGRLAGYRCGPCARPAGAVAGQRLRSAPRPAAVPAVRAPVRAAGPAAVPGRPRARTPGAASRRTSRRPAAGPSGSVAQQRRGEQGVAQHGQGERRRSRCSTAVRLTAERRKCSASTMLTRAMSSSGYASDSAACATLGPSELGRVGEREAPGEGEQRAADQPGVQRQADPAGPGHRPLGEDQQPHDGGRREAQEEEVGELRAGHVPVAARPRTSPRRRCRAAAIAEESAKSSQAGRKRPRRAGVEEAATRPRCAAAALSPKSPMIRASSREPQPSADPMAYPAHTRASRSCETVPDALQAVDRRGKDAPASARRGAHRGVLDTVGLGGFGATSGRPASVDRPAASDPSSIGRTSPVAPSRSAAAPRRPFRAELHL